MFIWKVPKLLPSKIIVTRLIAEMHWFLLLISDRVKLIIQRGHNKLLLKQKKKKKKEFPYLLFPLYLLLDHSVATGTKLLSHVFFKNWPQLSPKSSQKHHGF